MKTNTGALLYRFFSCSKLVVYLVLLSSCSAQSRLVKDVEEIRTVETLSYYLYYPPAYETDTKRNFPLLLFLHGGGESGGELGDLETGGPPKLIAEGKEFPFLILAPQHPHKDQWWNVRAAKQLLDSVVSSNRVDRKRIYLTGLSRGGAAAWEMAVNYPEDFAALAVVCGMAPLPYASWLDKDMPIWVFHGERDRVIPFSESEDMVEKLNSLGYDVRFTSYPELGHDSWTRAYQTEALYEWFNKQRRQE